MMRPMNSDWVRQHPFWCRWLSAGERCDASTKMPDRMMLWVDAVGSYLVCLGDEVVLGQPAADGAAPEVPILGDLVAPSCRHPPRRGKLFDRSLAAGAGRWKIAFPFGSAVGRKHDRAGGRGANAIPPAASAKCHGAVRFYQPASHPAVDQRRAADGRHVHPGARSAQPRGGPAMAARSGVVRQRGRVGLPNVGKDHGGRNGKETGRCTLGPRCRVEGEEFAFSLEPVAMSG